MAAMLHNSVENFLQQPGLIFRSDGTLNKQESTTNIVDPVSGLMVAYENNPVSGKHHYITSYKLPESAVKEFMLTGNVGLSKVEKKFKKDEFQKAQAKKEREQENARSFYSKLPNDARISNKQFDEYINLKRELKVDPKLPLTPK